MRLPLLGGFQIQQEIELIQYPVTLQWFQDADNGWGLRHAKGPGWSGRSPSGGGGTDL